MGANPTKRAYERWQDENGGEDFLQLFNGQGSALNWIAADGSLNINNGGVNPSGPVVLGSFGGAATASHGVAVEVFHTDFLNQAAALSAQTVYTVPSNRAGFFRVAWLAKVTQAASSSSVLGGGSAFQVTYQDGIDGTTLTTPSTAFSGNAGNVLTTQGSGQVMCYASAGSVVQVNFGYTSSGATPMQYVLHVRIEDM